MRRPIGGTRVAERRSVSKERKSLFANWIAAARRDEAVARDDAEIVSRRTDARSIEILTISLQTAAGVIPRMPTAKRRAIGLTLPSAAALSSAVRQHYDEPFRLIVRRRGRFFGRNIPTVVFTLLSLLPV